MSIEAPQDFTSEYFREKYNSLPRGEYFQPGPVAPWAYRALDDRVLRTEIVKTFLDDYAAKSTMINELADRMPDEAVEDLGDDDIATQESAVLVPLVENKGIVESVVVMTRTMTVSTHKGQVSFPGGMIEPDDVDVIDTALRETSEEIGIDRDAFHVLGSHSPAFTRGRKGHITPVVATCSSSSIKTVFLNRDEVDTLHIIALADLVAPDAYMSEVWDFGDFAATIHMFFVHDRQGKPVFIWGATAHMLTNLLHCLNQ